MTGTWTGWVLDLEPTFRRAPSAHNTQPATLFIDGAALVVGWDPDRELTVADPTRRDLWLSVGAFVESIAIAAADAGLGVAVEWDVDTRAHRVARLVEAEPRRVAGGFTAGDLRARRTARGPYAEPFVGAVALAEVAAGAGAAGDVRVDVLGAHLVDELLPSADRWVHGSPAQVAELRRWLRLDRSEPRYRVDGLTDEALALTPLQARVLGAALSPKVWPGLRRVGGPRLLALSSRNAGRGTVVALHVPAPDAGVPERVAERGRALLRTWLAAQRHGLHVHPLSQLIDSPRTAPRLDDGVSAPDDERRVLSVFRIGRPTTDPVCSARIPVSSQARDARPDAR